VDSVIDLDMAAAEIEAKRAEWMRAGLVVRPVTWRDQAEGWPPPIKTDRALVVEPDSVGVLVENGGRSTMQVVLFKGGWADVDLIDWAADAVVTDNPTVADVAAFGRLLDGFAQRLGR
jgi:hypothetical protein